jgi:hypothetical protein
MCQNKKNVNKRALKVNKCASRGRSPDCEFRLDWRALRHEIIILWMQPSVARVEVHAAIGALAHLPRKGARWLAAALTPLPRGAATNAVSRNIRRWRALFYIIAQKWLRATAAASRHHIVRALIWLQFVNTSTQSTWFFRYLRRQLCYWSFMVWLCGGRFWEFPGIINERSRVEL